MARLQDKEKAADLETGHNRSVFVQKTDRESNWIHHFEIRRGLTRAAAAGMTGILFAGGAVKPAAAAESSETETVSSREDDWEQLASGALQQWELEEDRLPPEEEEEISPDPPEELVPYFEEWTEKAGAAYGNSLPPQKDLRRYSRRADAIRRLVREAAADSLQRKSGQIRRTLLELAHSAGEESVPMLVRALQEKETAPVPVSFRIGARDSTAGEGGGRGRTEVLLPLARNSAESSARPAGTPINRFLKDVNDGESLPEESFEEQNFYEAISRQYAPRDWKNLPVPPGLYDFSIRFPAMPWKMRTQGGQSLFPGLSGYTQIVDQDAHSAEAARLAGLRKALAEEEQERRGQDSREQDSREQDSREQDRREQELSAAQKAQQSLSPDAEKNDPAVAAGSGYDPAVPGLPALETLVSPDPAISGTWISRLAADGEGQKTEPSRRLVLVGDSRTVGMQIYVRTEGEVFWSAANSMGYSWMVKTGVPAVEKQIGENTDVVFLMGVNDLGNVSRYIDYMNEKAAEWKKLGARTFFVSVNPVDDRRSPNAKNARIESFNAYAQENLKGVCYIDAYSRIRNSFGSPDGIHFDAGTYREIYRIIRFYVYRGWYETQGLRFYFSCGKPVTGWQFLDGRWQYFDGNGVRWIRNGWAGDVCIAPYPETGLLNPYDAVRHH